MSDGTNGLAYDTVSQTRSHGGNRRYFENVNEGGEDKYPCSDSGQPDGHTDRKSDNNFEQEMDEQSIILPLEINILIATFLLPSSPFARQEWEEMCFLIIC